MTRPRDAGERGSATLEAAVVAPVLLAIVAILIAAGRVGTARGALEEAARDAARQASVSRTAADAKIDATKAAETTLRHQGLTCSSIQVTVDTSGFRRPPGTPASVRATVRCTVALGDLGIPGMGRSKTLTVSHDSPIDTYRDRAGGFANSEALVRANSGVGR
jgi:Flp pilus assembly protein TadG